MEDSKTSKATIPFAEGDIIDRNDIISTLEGNFDEYKTDGRNLEIAAGAVYDIQSGMGGSAVSGSGRNMGVSSSISGRNASGAIRSLSSTQYRTIAKGITSSLAREGYIELNDRAKMEGSKTIESEESPMVSVLEDGRIVKLKDATFSELINGEWKPLSGAVSLEDHMNSRVLSESELKELNISE